MQATIHVSPGGTNAYFEGETRGDLLLCSHTSNQAVRIGTLDGVRSMVTVTSNAAVVNGLMESENVQTNVVAATALNLTPYGGGYVSVVGGGSGGGAPHAPSVDASDASTISTTSDVSVLTNTRRVPLDTKYGVSIDGYGDGRVAIGNDGSFVVSGSIVSDLSKTVYDADNTESATVSVVNPGPCVVKYDGATGTALWGTTVLQADVSETVKSVTVAKDGSVYTAGAYRGAGALFSARNNAPSGLTLDAPVSGYAGFLVKHSADGAAQWGAHVTGSGSDGFRGCATDTTDGSVYAVGSLSSDDAVIYDAGNVSSAVQPVGTSVRCVLCKYDAFGFAQWTAGVAAAGGVACAVDGDGSVYVLGRGTETTPSQQTIYDAYAGESSITLADEAFLLKFEAYGSLAWATKIAKGTPVSVVCGAAGSVYVGVGDVSSQTVVYDAAGVADTSITASVATTGSAVIKYDASTGDPMWLGAVENATNSTGAVAYDSTTDTISLCGSGTDAFAVYDAGNAFNTSVTFPAPSVDKKYGFCVQFTSAGVALAGRLLESSFDLVIYGAAARAGKLLVGGQATGASKAYKPDGTVLEIRTSGVYGQVVMYDTAGYARYKLLSALTAADNGTTKYLVNVSQAADAQVDVRDAGDAATLKTVTVPKDGSKSVTWYGTSWY